jgi:hypothetical protein
MTSQPVLPLSLLFGIAAAILVLRVVALRRLTGAARTRVAVWRWSALTSAMLLLIMAAARPVIEPHAQSATHAAGRQAPNVFLVVDRSPDMRVQDYPDGKSRTVVAREDMAALIDRYPGARVAVISFATKPTLEWPLSADTWSLRPLASTVEPYASAPDTVTQTNAGAAENMLRYQLIGAVQQYPAAKNLVFYLGAGAPESQLPPRSFDLPKGAVDGGAVLGYGTGDGGPIPGTDVARSAIGEHALRGIAGQIGVPYIARDVAEPLASAVPTDTTDAAPELDAPRESRGRTERYWAPAALAAALILVELYLVLREFRRTRLVNTDVIV